jgi:hypothetical protein
VQKCVVKVAKWKTKLYFDYHTKYSHTLITPTADWTKVAKDVHYMKTETFFRNCNQIPKSKRYYSKKQNWSHFWGIIALQIFVPSLMVRICIVSIITKRHIYAQSHRPTIQIIYMKIAISYIIFVLWICKQISCI